MRNVWKTFTLFILFIVSLLAGVEVRALFIFTEDSTQRIRYVLEGYNLQHYLIAVIVSLIVYLVLEFNDFYFRKEEFKNEK